LDNKSEKNESRRSFLKRISIWSMTGAIFAQGFIYIRSLFPNVLYERPRRYKIGLPDQYATGVSFLDRHSVFVFKEENRFHAISAVCTHLGCTVKYAKLNKAKTVNLDGQTLKMEGEFHCPCHGSKFHENGKNFEGPAPTPLEWYDVSISPDDGQLIIDVAIKVNQDFRLTV
jgi:cytochrome b6-f complex iron-sulfur subunit